jgi:hypothetical protein
MVDDEWDLRDVHTQRYMMLALSSSEYSYQYDHVTLLSMSFMDHGPSCWDDWSSTNISVIVLVPLANEFSRRQEEEAGFFHNVLTRLCY